MLSFKNFLNYLNKNSNNLTEAQLEILHEILFCNVDDVYITSHLLSKKLNIRKSFANEILIGLSKFADLPLQINCSSCGMENKYDEKKVCVYCNAPLEEDDMYAKIEGKLSEEKKYLNAQETVRKEQLEQIILTWKKNKSIAYVLIDISNSEVIQYQNNGNYNRYLRCLREMITKDCLSVVKGNYLCFGEIGDCFKLGFSESEDVLIFIKKIGQKHYENYINGFYPKVVEGVSPYPCLKISAQSIELSHLQKPEDLLCTTISGVLDFNSDVLTGLFRIDGNIHLDYDKVFTKNNKVCAWIFDNLAVKLNLKGKTIHIDASKHKEIVSQADAIALTFPNGEMEISETPDVYLRKDCK